MTLHHDRRRTHFNYSLFDLLIKIDPSFNHPQTQNIKIEYSEMKEKLSFAISNRSPNEIDFKNTPNNTKELIPSSSLMNIKF